MLTQIAELNQTLRAMKPMALVDSYADYSRHVFSSIRKDALPVIVCARDEERDLPATLLSIALSDLEVRPIVIDNASRDNTASIARAMGAILLEEPIPGKMAALKTGLSFTQEELAPDRVLFTDADTIVGHKWASSMSSKLPKQKQKIAIAAGLVCFTHGSRKDIDIFRSIRITGRKVYDYISGVAVAVSGCNFALQAGDNSELINHLQHLPDNLAPGEDLAIRDAVQMLGGDIIASFAVSTLVMTRGDRVESWKQYHQLLRNSISYTDLFHAQYGANLQAYEGSGSIPLAQKATSILECTKYEQRVDGDRSQTNESRSAFSKHRKIEQVVKN